MYMKIWGGKIAFVVVSAALFLGGIFFYEQGRFFDGKFHVVFCDVGQGDAIFLRTPRGVDILVDGGPNDSVLSCLSRHMPFWDKTIELVLLTHPHADHFTGLIDVLDRYTVIAFNTEKLANNTTGFRHFSEKFKAGKTKSRFVSTGDTFRTKDGVVLYVLSPSRAFLSATAPEGIISESGEFASLVLIVSFGTLDVLLSGDSQIDGLREALGGQLPPIEVFQVPHHGSKNGLNETLLEALRPRVAVISVGKNNRYGHPHSEILRKLGDQNVRIFRTDRDGEVEVVSDGEKWHVSSSRKR